MITPEAFIRHCERDGFTEVVHKTWPAGTVLEPHTHAWDARLLVTAGVLHLRRAGVEHAYAVGDTCEVARDEPHAERYGDTDVQLVICRRS
jgi:quercetin dioxygenase-like cupin family protein